MIVYVTPGAKTQQRPQGYLQRQRGSFSSGTKKLILSLVLICSDSYYFAICLAFYWHSKLTEIISLAYNAQFRFILSSSYYLLWHRQQPKDLVSCKLEQALSQKSRASPNTSPFVLSLQDFESAANCRKWIVFNNYTISFSQLPPSLSFWHTICTLLPTGSALRNGRPHVINTSRGIRPR